MNFVESLLEKELIPDVLVRYQIRRLLKQRLSEEENSNKENFIDLMRKSQIAVDVKAANDQHYEVPSGFFERTLGKRLKYSCGYFNTGRENLDDSEVAMLEITCSRAELCDGQDILELGCGWGSLTLFMAEKYPNSRIIGVSNSASQKEYILGQAAFRGLKNIEIITCDMNQFFPDKYFERKYDRVVSVEMFEHMRNVEELLKRINLWLKDDGKLFVHIFTHREYAYLFEVKDSSDWMARHFFTGGMMPSHDLYSRLSSGLEIEQSWVVPGTHYGRTSELWLEKMDKHESEIRTIFAETYGKKNVSRWWSRWRVFFMACAELWNFKGGAEWQVSHYRFRKVKS